MKTCKQCKKLYETSVADQQFCSRDCANRASIGVRRIKLRRRVKLTCQQCGKPFETTPYHQKLGRRFCSKPCVIAYVAGLVHAGVIQKKRGISIEKMCQSCGKQFSVPQFRHDSAKFCSHTCQIKKMIGKAQQLERLDVFNLTREQVGYLAGLMDGEGSIYFRKTTWKKWARDGAEVGISIANTDKNLAKWLTLILNIGKIQWRPITGRMTKPIFHYRIRSAFGCYQFLRLIEPHLIIKRAKAQEVIKFLQDRYHFD